MTARPSDPSRRRTPVEEALRNLGARKYGNVVKIIEYAVGWPNSGAEAILQPLASPTSTLSNWTVAERAHAVWKVIEEGIAHPQVGGMAGSRERYALQAAFRLPDVDVDMKWGASLADRFKQLRAAGGAFDGATSNQPVEMAWKHGVERLAEYVEGRLDELRTPADWAPYRPVEPGDMPPATGPTTFRKPSEGAQKLIVDLYTITLLMKGRLPARRIAERFITSQDDEGLKYYTSAAFSSGSELLGRTYVPTIALWGCRAERVQENGVSLTRLWFPRPLRTGEQAYFVTEVVYAASEDDVEAWTNVEIDHFGIEPGRLRGGVLPQSGLTIRTRFDPEFLPKAMWWYAEQNERERYQEPPPGSPRLLDAASGDVSWTFEQPCQPRESYGVAYRW